METRISIQVSTNITEEAVFFIFDREMTASPIGLYFEKWTRPISVTPSPGRSDAIHFAPCCWVKNQIWTKKTHSSYYGSIKRMSLAEDSDGHGAFINCTIIFDDHPRSDTPWRGMLHLSVVMTFLSHSTLLTSLSVTWHSWAVSHL